MPECSPGVVSGAQSLLQEHSISTKAAVSHLQLALLNLETQLSTPDRDEDRRSVLAAKKCVWDMMARYDSHHSQLFSQMKEEKKVALPLTSLTSSQDTLEKSKVPPHAVIDMHTRASSPLDEEDVVELPGELKCESSRTLEARRGAWLPAADGDEVQAGQKRLLNIFAELDQGGFGEVQRADLRRSLYRHGIHAAKSYKLVQTLDKDGDGKITCKEWKDVVSALGHGDKITDVVESLLRQSESSFSGESWVARREAVHGPDRLAPPLTLRYDSPYRLAWDVCIMLLLCYIAISLPVSIGFHGVMSIHATRGLEMVEHIIDVVFCIDIIINFRTTYVNEEGAHVVNSWEIARSYLCTWFALDLVSSAPIDLLFTSVPNLQVAKLLKIGKAAKALKMFRIRKLKKHIDRFDWADHLLLDSNMTGKWLYLCLIAFCFCHWLACFMPAVDGGEFLRDVGGDNLWTDFWTCYLSSMYFAMTTITSVGYGDIVPKTNSERAYTMFAQIIGVGFYGYAIGSITAAMTSRDANARAYHERLDLIMAWLNYHNELPREMVRRIRRHFKQVLGKKCALDDSEILKDLSPELRSDLSKYLINDQVKHCLLFEGLPLTAFAMLVPVLQLTHVEANERIVTSDEPGVAMFIISDGSAHMSQQARDGSMNERKLGVGDSFGEEIILGLDERYTYTVTSTSPMSLHMLQELEFKACFQALPEMFTLMTENYLRCQQLQRQDATSSKMSSVDSTGSRMTRSPTSGLLSHSRRSA